MLVSKDIEPVTNQRRSRLNLTLGFAIGIVLFFLNLGINFPDQVAMVFALDEETVGYLRPVLNVLLVWLVVLIVLAFYRWRDAERGQANLENVLAGISPDTLCVVNPERKIVLCTDSVKRMFGYLASELMGKKTDMLYSDRRRRDDDPREIYEQLSKSGFHIGIASGIRRDGTRFPLEIISGDLPERRGVVLLMRDITDRMREESARRDAEHRMQEREHLESLGVLAGGVAHDFNNLLAAILGNAELALEDVQNTEVVRDYLKKIIDGVDRSAAICKDLLAYSGTGNIKVSTLNLAEIIRAQQGFVEEMAGPSIRVVCDISEDPLWVDGDPRQLQQLILNLASNAVESLEDKSEGRVVISLVEVDYSDELFKDTHGGGLPGQRYALLQVADNGCGISDAIRKDLFKPFFSTKFPGRGLGLSSAQGILRTHDGAIQIDSSEGRGTTVTVLLPVAPIPGDAGGSP